LQKIEISEVKGIQVDGVTLDKLSTVLGIEDTVVRELE
jgi:hypothetical protein